MLLAPLSVPARPAGTPAEPVTPPPRPHIIAVLQDDLGWGDVGFTEGQISTPLLVDDNSTQYRAERVRAASSHLHDMVKSGIQLDRQYVHFYCSPSRRSFLSGRTARHHTELLSGGCTDEMDLRWTSLGQKMKQAGYATYYVGKGHTGFRAMAHMPTNQGFDGFFGFLGGRREYAGESDLWLDDKPHKNTTYSTIQYAEYAIGKVLKHDPATPFFMYLSWQSVHEPYEEVPADLIKKAGSRVCAQTEVWGDFGYANYINMLAVTDYYQSALTDALKEKGMWENTLLLYASDNGGTAYGNNYPLRGEKQTNFEGGIRAAAFLAGGFIPTKLRGTRSNLVVGIHDWYPTFCHLAGVDPTDQDASKGEYPDVDGVNVWPYIEKGTKESDAAHDYLWVTSQVLIKGDYKLMVAQPKIENFEELLQNYPNMEFPTGWRHPRGHDSEGNRRFYDQEEMKKAADDAGMGKAKLWQFDGSGKAAVLKASDTVPSRPNSASDEEIEERKRTGEGPRFVGALRKCETFDEEDEASPEPCLFNVGTDAIEMHDLSSEEKELMKEMSLKLQELNEGKTTPKSPVDLTGPCDEACYTFWESGGPICGVPGCPELCRDYPGHPGCPEKATHEPNATQIQSQCDCSWVKDDSCKPEIDNGSECWAACCAISGQASPEKATQEPNDTQIQPQCDCSWVKDDSCKPEIDDGSECWAACCAISGQASVTGEQSGSAAQESPAPEQSSAAVLQELAKVQASPAPSPKGAIQDFAPQQCDCAHFYESCKPEDDNGNPCRSTCCAYASVADLAQARLAVADAQAKLASTRSGALVQNTMMQHVMLMRDA